MKTSSRIILGSVLLAGIVAAYFYSKKMGTSSNSDNSNVGNSSGASNSSSSTSNNGFPIATAKKSSSDFTQKDAQTFIAGGGNAFPRFIWAKFDTTALDTNGKPYSFKKGQLLGVTSAVRLLTNGTYQLTFATTDKSQYLTINSVAVNIGV